jgi:hypothetical protein
MSLEAIPGRQVPEEWRSQKTCPAASYLFCPSVEVVRLKLVLSLGYGTSVCHRANFFAVRTQVQVKGQCSLPQLHL